MLSHMRSLIPRSTWSYGEDLCDGLYNIETVFLHQNDVIDHGKEDCHHLTVCVVGAAAAGKTSVIRKLTDEPFQAEHKPTEMMDVSTIRPTQSSTVPAAVKVTENLIRIKDWELVAEKTDTDEIIAHRVASTLNEHSAKEKGSVLLYLLRVLTMNQLVIFTCICSIVNGSQPLATICISIFVGFVCLGRNDTALRMSMGCATMNYIVVAAAARYLYAHCQDGYCSQCQYMLAMAPMLFTAVAWGTLTGLGLNPGIASGLAIVKMDKSVQDSVTIIDHIYPGTTKTFTLERPSIPVLRYWVLLNMVAILGFAINNKACPKHIVLLVTSLFGLVAARFYLLGYTCMSVSELFPLTVFVCYLIGPCSLPVGRSAAAKQEPVGLERMDLAKSLFSVHLPGVVVGALAGVFINGGSIEIHSLNDCFVIFAILVLIFILSKASPVYQFFSASAKSTRYTSDNHSSRPMHQSSVLPNSPRKKLHSCFKLLVRDFAGQMVYHCMHQPFLPRYGVFICTFSWKRAKETSLVYAEKRNQMDERPDYCLEEIIFWLKNVSMHRIHPNVQVGSKTGRPDVMDQENIKNVFLVATHSHMESCELSEEQKSTIMSYYRSILRKHSDLYSSIEFDVSDRGEISIENSDELKDTGIEVLKKHLLLSAEEVVNHCFPDALPVYFWCWLKEKRDKCQLTQSPPCELMLKSHIDVDGKYMSVYPQDKFHEKINKFCDIGEIFLVRNKEESIVSSDYYIFYNIQFLIDFMKDMVSIDEKKTRDRLKADEWKLLQLEGRGHITLLEHHLKKFYASKKMDQMYSHLRIEDQPLVRSILQLDFVFFVGEEFFLPQLLPKYREDDAADDAKYFQEVCDILWEYVFDFGDFDFHHEYIFFRLLARCARHEFCEKHRICCDWASFYTTHSDTKSRDFFNDDSKPWFTLSCEKRGKDDGQHNRIYLRTCADYNHKHSLVLLQKVSEAIESITKESFSKLGGMVTSFFNCPNRISLRSTHKIQPRAGRLQCGVGCVQNQVTYLVRIDPDGVPYIGVSDDIKDWLCAELDDEQFNSLLSLLLNINIEYVRQQFTQPNKSREEVKNELLKNWTDSYDASLNALIRGLELPNLQDITQMLTERFPC